jgi:hypothetical protein
MRNFKIVSLLFIFLVCFGNACAQQPIAQCQGIKGWGASAGTARTFLWKPDALLRGKLHYEKGGDNSALQQLQKDANTALAMAPLSVTSKRRIPKGASAHDYTSLAPYWWPERSGRPYVRRDGETNPERDASHYDLKRLISMSQAVEALGLMYYYSGEKKYAVKAAELIRAWFLTKATQMAPNMNFAQSIPGRAAGRAEGVLDLRHFIPVIETIGLIEASGALSTAEHKLLRDWFSQLVQWLAISPLGKEERAARNNHGIFYDLILSHFALYSGYEDVAKTVLANVGKTRLSQQIATDGSMPLELARTRSFHYSAWTAGALFDLADLSRCFGSEQDFWRYRADGKDLHGVLKFLSSYLGREADWQWPELKPDGREFQLALRRAAIAQADSTLSARLAAAKSKYASDRYFLLWPLPGEL